MEGHCKRSVPQPSQQIPVVDCKGFQLFQAKGISIGHHGVKDNGFEAQENIFEGVKDVDEEPNKGTWGYPIPVT